MIHIHSFTQLLPLHNKWLTQFEASMIRKHLRYADAIVGCSEFIVQRVRDKFPELRSRCSAVYNAVETNGILTCTKGGE